MRLGMFLFYASWEILLHCPRKIVMGSDEHFYGPILAHDDFALSALPNRSVKEACHPFIRGL
jgi:hypothetical protein